MKTKLINSNLHQRTILSVDVSYVNHHEISDVMGTIIINVAIPVDNNYVSNIIHMEKYEKLTADKLALLIRKLYDIYECTDLAINTDGAGLLIYDKLIQNIAGTDTDELYPAISCCNNEVMAGRCKVDNAPKVIWAININAFLNNEMYFLVRNGFQNDKINLYVSEVESEEFFREIASFEYEVKDSMVKLVNKIPTDYLSRYFSLAYNYWIQCQIEKEIKMH